MQVTDIDAPAAVRNKTKRLLTNGGLIALAITTIACSATLIWWVNYQQETIDQLLDFIYKQCSSPKEAVICLQNDVNFLHIIDQYDVDIAFDLSNKTYFSDQLSDKLAFLVNKCSLSDIGDSSPLTCMHKCFNVIEYSEGFHSTAQIIAISIIAALMVLAVAARLIYNHRNRN